MDFLASRKELGMSQADMAAALGVSQSTISRFETGDIKPSRRDVLALSALLAEQARGEAA